MMILPTNDPTIKHLRRSFGKTKNVEGMRLGGQMIGDRFTEDAYVYRISLRLFYCAVTVTDPSDCQPELLPSLVSRAAM